MNELQCNVHIHNFFNVCLWYEFNKDTDVFDTTLNIYASEMLVCPVECWVCSYGVF